ncbi:hypothetical protein F5Y14DRAFT_329379 [Nemania sp. NC0429]|nr:hypothetical protein F5Y14DRAFT_329379 [Nemania sp. NC0429]
MANSPNFRVVILGAGPVGLMTAHALHAAGIDYVVLERQPEIVRFRGALIIVGSPLVRLLEQLGLSEPLLEYSTRIVSKTNITGKGEPLCTNTFFADLEDELGYPTLGLSRGNLLRVLYDNLPERETRVRANAEAVKIETSKDGVQVHLADGSVVDGSIVIAADGVHSPAREFIQRRGQPGGPKPESPMIPGYLCLFGHTQDASREEIPLGDFTESHGHGVVSQSARLADTTFFSILKTLENKASRTRFTREELDAFVEEMSHVHLFPGVPLNDLWTQRQEGHAVLLHQEEGVAEQWHHDRVVLVGDAAHKMTSINGLGAVSGGLSTAVLVSNLRRLLQKTPSPSTEEIDAAFAAYQARRLPITTQIVKYGMQATRAATWTGENTEAKDRENSRGGATLARAGRRLVLLLSRSPILDYVPFESKHGKTPWAAEGEDGAVEGL